MGYTDRREVKQFQYTAWPDHGVPEHPAPFLQFLRRVVAMNTPDAGPVITHCRQIYLFYSNYFISLKHNYLQLLCYDTDCNDILIFSAGVGRTGAFIVIDSMLERIKHEKTIDVYGHVTCLRAQRNYMVKTEDQYTFIHDALLEAVMSGFTEVRMFQVI